MSIPAIVMFVVGLLWLAAAVLAPNKLAVVVITAWFGALGLAVGTVLVHLHPVIRIQRVNSTVVPDPSIQLIPGVTDDTANQPILTNITAPEGARLRVMVRRSTTTYEET